MKQEYNIIYITNNISINIIIKKFDYYYYYYYITYRFITIYN